MDLSIEDLNNLHLDVLREIGNIGAGNAATALAGLINKRIDMNVPSVKILDFNDVSAVLGGEEIVVSGVYFEVEGDIEGNIMFLLDLRSAKVLTNILMGREDPSNELDEMDHSALQEIGNILSGAYISSLSSLTNLNIKISIPSLCIDMAGAIISVPAIQFGYMGDKVLLIETILQDGNDTVKGNFFLIPEAKSFKTLLNSLGVYI
ncbi:chemotaxis protein CheC [Alkaliphilus sp. MSJ-5]|uniref:Chemotaxis protein CheC n=1 Tax=Alkaliphilus flagellatus TaxID=2841507 RepID=A0ABS6G4L6_9FIRM|nr:chemotaxis protein CheC [Alkaliphilus flagellatus]MBU5677440.1 chemotaxis protein CheC [Alkaliphilus flagellatus]